MENFGSSDKKNKLWGSKLKFLRNFVIAMVIFFSSNIIAGNLNYVSTSGVNAVSDSINLVAEFSLFYEAERNGQFDDWTMEKGFNVINTDPTQFVKYKIFTRLEEVLFALHDSSDADEAMKQAYADTLIYMYDKAVQYDKERESYYLVKKAYVLENWFPDIDPQVVIDAYMKAFDTDWTLDDVYKDRLGQFYVLHDRKLDAIDWYDRLATDDPENERWQKRLEGLVDSPEELLDIYVRSWKSNPDKLDKAWKVGAMAVKVKNYAVAKEAFEELVSKAPDVINYWKQLATVYDKLEETDNSIKAYKKLIELQPENRDNFVNIALVYKKIDQLAIARSYLIKASNADPSWDYPLYIEGSLYEQSARECMGGKLDFMDKCVFKLAVDTYAQARAKGGPYASTCAERISALSPTLPTKEDYFFRQISDGATIKIEGKCYSWIGKSTIAKF